jgi:hypothetical protein
VPNPATRTDGALARFRSERPRPRAPRSYLKTSRRIHQARHDATAGNRQIESPAPVRAACFATLRQQHRDAHRAFALACVSACRIDRCVRLTSTNPNCQRRAPVVPVLTATGRFGLACRGALRGSRRRSELRSAARDDSERVRLVDRPCNSPLAVRHRTGSARGGGPEATEIVLFADS